MNVIPNVCVAVCAGMSVLTCARELQAQRPDEMSGIVGVVYDSSAAAPLRGAMIRVRDANVRSWSYQSLSDSLGQFRIVGLSPGKYVVRLDHERLATLHVRFPERYVEVRGSAVMRVDFGVPSLPSIRADRCGLPKSGDASGIMLGMIASAEDRGAIRNPRLTATWQSETSLAERTNRPSRSAILDSTIGAFTLCGLPVGVDVRLAASAPGRHSVEGSVRIPVSGVLAQNLLLVETLRSRGVARVYGEIAGADERPLSTGKASIPLLSLDVDIVSGRFAIVDVPLGTWTLRLRSIGMEQRDLLVTVGQPDVDVGVVRLTSAAQTIDAVRVLANRSATDAVLDEVRKRQRSAFGTVFLPGHPALATAVHTADVLREARGFQYRGPTIILGRERITNGQSRRCDEIAVYVNGMILPGGFADLDLVAPATDVLAVEAYPDVLFAPLQYRSNVGVDYQRSRARKETFTGVCAVVLVWTKYQFPRTAPLPP